MYKLKCLGTCGRYYGLIHSFLDNRHQRVVLNGQCSNCSKIKAGVLQGSILSPLVFLVYINYLPEGLTTSANFFADEMSFFQLSTILRHNQFCLAMTNNEFLNGLTNGKKYSTQISQNRSMRYSFSKNNHN